MCAAQYFDFKSPRLWLTSGSMGTMGFGLPAAIGAAFAQKNRTVIDIDGDASIRMNFGELETATTYKQIGRASCRERVCQYVWISVVAVSYNKKKNNKMQKHQQPTINTT